MKFDFYKYHGTGNDFILIDDREEKFSINNTALIRQLCHRHFGIGADGLILIRNTDKADFEMVYFNSDGKPASLCGNGSRCALAFSAKLGIIEKKASFKAFDGIHMAVIDDQNITVFMHDVSNITQNNAAYILNTGSPHYIQFVPSTKNINVFEEGRKIRYKENYKSEGININFVEIEDKWKINVRTYERGVENETLSCGTGVVASAIATSRKQGVREGLANYQIITKGGNLNVEFNIDENDFTNVKLSGKVEEVFKGEIDLP